MTYESYRDHPIDGGRSQTAAVIDAVSNVILGKQAIVELVLVAMLAGGHCLLEDVPGVGKTMLARALAKAVGGNWKRIQFTPDLMPSDVTGVSVYRQDSQTFVFHPGPVFTEVLVADEINRAAPRTQSALLEAMEERSVTVDGTTYPLSKLFFVLATENPIEYQGTYQLPEAQLDRFLFRLQVGYPSFSDEIAMLGVQQSGHPIDTMSSVATSNDVGAWRRQVTGVYVDGLIKQYIVEIVQGTRQHPLLVLGASPRASLALFRSAQALAYIRGRDYVVPDDVRELVPHVLNHRLVLTPETMVLGVTPVNVVAEILEQTEVPSIAAYPKGVALR